MSDRCEKATSFLSNCALIVAWLYANRLALKWLWDSLSQLSGFNQILVSLVACGLLIQGVRVFRKNAAHKNFNFLYLQPKPRVLPLFLLLGCGIGAIALQWLFDLEQLRVFLFLLGTYGLCGLFIPSNFWRRGLPIAAIVACLLPFSPPLGNGFGGLPARVLTAHIVEQLLANWHITAISSHDIIVLENGIAQIDLPCSGLKSLWIGTLFLLATTPLENRQIGLRWLLVCGCNLFLLFSVNTLRVLLIVLMGQVLQQPEIAQILHIPLGLLGFICACAFSWIMLQWVPKQKQGSRGDKGDKGDKGAMERYLSGATGLLGIIVTLALISNFTPNYQLELITQISWADQLVGEPLPLTTAEQRFFNYNSTLLPEKRRFVQGDISGSILVVANTSWRTYHPPELCHVGSGLKVDWMEKKQLTPEVLARWLSLQNGQISATYWLQTSQQTTDDFFTSLWHKPKHNHQNWVLVSILFDRSLSPTSPQVHDLATTIYNTINQSLTPKIKT